MNPPFSEGARHLLHAPRIMERPGGRCRILNAERSATPAPTSAREFPRCSPGTTPGSCTGKGAFTHAARKTSVEVALVFVTIPPAPPVSPHQVRA